MGRQPHVGDRCGAVERHLLPRILRPGEGDRHFPDRYGHQPAAAGSLHRHRLHQGRGRGQDPALFVDEDGQPYLFWGCGGNCFGAKLADDLMSVVSGTIVRLTDQLTYVYEGPWVHKYRGKYYLSYPAEPIVPEPNHPPSLSKDKGINQANL